MGWCGEADVDSLTVTMLREGVLVVFSFLESEEEWWRFKLRSAVDSGRCTSETSVAVRSSNWFWRAGASEGRVQQSYKFRQRLDADVQKGRT